MVVGSGGAEVVDSSVVDVLSGAALVVDDRSEGGWLVLIEFD